MAIVEEKDVSIDSEGNGSWSINMTGPIGGTYQGLFKFRSVLSPIQLIEADRDYRDLLGKNSEFAATHVENLAYTITQLAQRVIKAPPFWSDGSSRYPGSQIRDIEVIQAVYEASIVAETKFRAQLKEKHKESIDRLKKTIEAQEQSEKDDAELAQMDLDAEAKPKKKKKNEAP